MKIKTAGPSKSEWLSPEEVELWERLNHIKEKLFNTTHSHGAKLVDELEDLEKRLSEIEQAKLEKRSVNLSDLQPKAIDTLSSATVPIDSDTTIQNSSAALNTLLASRERLVELGDVALQKLISAAIERVEERIIPAIRLKHDQSLEEILNGLNSILQRGHGFIGSHKVFKEQIETCAEIFKAFDAGQNPLLIAEPQSGKTGVCLLTIFLFMRWLYHRSTLETSSTTFNFQPSVEIIYLTNIADKSIIDQNLDRAKELDLPATIRERIKIIHHAELRKLDRLPPRATEYTLIIDDECHYALQRDKPFHSFLKRRGIKYGAPKSKWKDQNTFLLSVSATCFSQVVQSMLDHEAFTPVVLAPSDKYYSLRRMFQDGRLKQSEPVALRVGKEYIVSDFFEQRLAEFIRVCELDGNGYLIVRATGVRAEKIIELLKSRRVEFRDYRSTLVDLKTLDKDLQKEPPYPTVCVIRGSMRAGKTLSTTRHIRGWIESPNANTDSMIQSGVGRCLGNVDATFHSKFDDRFPIYCNLAEIDAALGFYDQFYSFDGTKIVPTGRWNESVGDKQSYTRHFARQWEEIPESIRNGATIQSVSKNNKQDLALSALNGSKRSAHSPIIKLDSANPNHLQSWDALMGEYGAYRGGYAYFLDYDRADYTSLKANNLFTEPDDM